MLAHHPDAEQLPGDVDQRILLSEFLRKEEILAPAGPRSKPPSWSRRSTAALAAEGTSASPQSVTGDGLRFESWAE